MSILCCRKAFHLVEEGTPYHDDLHDHGDHGNYDDLVCNQLIDQVQEGAL